MSGAARSSPLGLPRLHLRSTGSTNDRARLLAVAGAPHGTVVTAGEQTAGRGRQGRGWASPPGSGLFASLIVRERGALGDLLPLAAGVAVCDACEAVCEVDCRLKWPNDVWIEGRKVAGILVEGRVAEGWAVVGVGVNVSMSAEELPPDVRASATSLRIAGGDACAGAGARRIVERVLSEYLVSFEAALLSSRSAVLDSWRSRDTLLGERIAWGASEGGPRAEGVASGVDDRGRLLVETAAGSVALAAGEVHLSVARGAGGLDA